MTGKQRTDWAAVATDYALSLPIAELCLRHRISRSGLYARAKAEGWVRGDSKPAAGAAPPQEAAAGAPPAAKASRRQIFHRLCRALDEKMTEFENRPKMSGASAADAEREARTLHSLIRMFEKLSALKLEAKTQGLQSAKAGEPKEPLADADTRRRQLAERLEKLRRGGG